MRRFINNSLLFAIPFLILLGCYIWFDPFKVIWNYDIYYIKGDGGSLNRNFVSTMNYLNRYKQHHYDSFIFGNSRSLCYRIEEWKKYIPQQSSCYHFSESGGSINGIYYKLRLIDEKGEKIRNALLVMDYTLLRHLEQDGRPFIMPPVLDHYRNFLTFHAEHFVQWMDVRFLYYWTKYELTGKFTPEMTGFLAKGTNYQYYDPVTNEEPRLWEDSLIAAGNYYNKSRLKEFKEKQTPSMAREYLSNPRQRDGLRDIRRMFDKHHTDYRIVISPLYDQVQLNTNDLQILYDIFGRDRVFDFSGVNKWTSDYHNYYEWSHYLPAIADTIMARVYHDK
ncbi:MAG: hypothetical protein IKX33_04835 [Prevotella sp.]|nr:hypothetical protein [Prevotella sp.]